MESAGKSLNFFRDSIAQGKSVAILETILLCNEKNRSRKRGFCSLTTEDRQTWCKTPN